LKFVEERILNAIKEKLEERKETGPQYLPTRIYKG
jgi:hypothetical protein